MNRRGQDRTGPLGGSGMVGLWGASSLITQVQYGTVSTAGSSGTATITSVDTTRSILINLGQTVNDASSPSPSEMYCRIILTNSTTITITRGTGGNPGARVVGFVVVEFAPGVLRSVQAAVLTISSGSSTTATISSVNTAKTVLLPLRTSSATTSALTGVMMDVYLTLTNTTTITATMDVAGTGAWTPNTGVIAMEFF